MSITKRISYVDVQIRVLRYPNQLVFIIIRGGGWFSPAPCFCGKGTCLFVLRSQLICASDDASGHAPSARNSIYFLRDAICWSLCRHILWERRPWPLGKEFDIVCYGFYWMEHPQTCLLRALAMPRLQGCCWFRKEFYWFGPLHTCVLGAVVMPRRHGVHWLSEAI